MKKSIFDKKMENGSIYPVAEKKAIHPIAIFKDGFLLWKKNFLCLSGIYLILHLPVIALQILFPDPRICGLIPGLKGSSLGVSFIVCFISSLFDSWAFIALSIGLNKAADGQICRIMENIKAAGRRLLPCLAIIILYTLLAVLVGVVAILGARVSFILLGSRDMVLYMVLARAVSYLVLITGVYFAIRLSLSFIVSIIEKQRPISASKRSYRLTKNYVSPIVGEYCLLALLFLIFFLPANFFVFLSKEVKIVYHCVIVYYYLLGAIVTPFFVGITVTLYKKLTEAVDV